MVSGKKLQDEVSNWDTHCDEMEEQSNLCIEHLLVELKDKYDIVCSLRKCIFSHVVWLSSHNIQESSTNIDSI